MPKTFNIRLDPASIDTAIKALKEYRRDIDRKAKELVTELATIGEQTAAPFFTLTDGDNVPATVSKEVSGNKAQVIAEGESAVFIEFGAGVGVDEHPQSAEFGFYPGSYSETHNGMYSRYGAWFYNGNFYTSIGAGKGMYYATRAMESALPETARRVFGK